MNASNANILFICIENNGCITGVLQGILMFRRGRLDPRRSM